MSSCTFAARALGDDDAADDARRRDDRHVGRETRRCVPLSMVTVRKLGVDARRDDLGGRRLQLGAVAQVEQLLEAAAAIGERALLLQLRPAPRRAARCSASFSARTPRRPT